MGSDATRPREALLTLSAFLPAYNEEANLERTVQGLLAVLPRVACTYEVIVVDDGSADGTADVARTLARSHPGVVRLVQHQHNRGYGAALRTGFAAALHDYVFFTDADGQFDPHDLVRLTAALGDRDAALGYRAQRADPWHRCAYARLWNAIVRRLLGIQVRDVNCAFKLFRRHAVADLDLRSDGATASAELLASVLRRGRTFVEIPVAHRPRIAGHPTGGRRAVILKAFAELIRLRNRLRAEPWGEPESDDRHPDPRPEPARDRARDDLDQPQRRAAPLW